MASKNEKLENDVSLSKREKEIISLIIKADCRKTIAQKLNISLHTVDAHIRHIHIKTGTHSIPELIVWTLRSNI
jgi:DNA-binding CsgD family transcriptional regulator